jgi:hypothetical protein
MSSVPSTSRFREARTPSGKKAFEAWTAVSDRLGVAFCTPTLDELKQIWREVIGTELIAEAAQHVWIVAFSTLDDAPHDKPSPANVACSVLGCKQQASFIIRKIAYCKEHRGVAR